MSEMALIRKCDGCGMVTAIDTAYTLQHLMDMQLIGHTVTRVSKEEAHKAWRDSGQCIYKELAKYDLEAANNRISVLEEAITHCVETILDIKWGYDGDISSVLKAVKDMADKTELSKK